MFISSGSQRVNTYYNKAQGFKGKLCLAPILGDSAIPVPMHNKGFRAKQNMPSNIQYKILKPISTENST